MRSASSGSTSQASLTPEDSIETSPAPIQLTRAPRPSSSSAIASTSRILGTLRSTTSSSVSRHAARIGSAPFLFPAGTIVSASEAPPSITNFSIWSGRLAAAPGACRRRREGRKAGRGALQRLSYRNRHARWCFAPGGLGPPYRVGLLALATASHAGRGGGDAGLRAAV